MEMESMTGLMRKWKSLGGNTETSVRPIYDRKYEQMRVNYLNDTSGRMAECRCDICKNKGFVYYLDDQGYISSRVCTCMTKISAMRRMAESGLANLLAECTMDRFLTKEPWQQDVKALAEDYISDPHGWFLASGRSGAGKTHICTAIAGELLEKGYDVRYMLWRDESAKIKSLVTDSDGYAKMIQPLKDVAVLYIDDFLKVGGNAAPSTGDINLAFEIINGRYYDPDKLTIISTERDIYNLLQVDEAVGSRIYERSKCHNCVFRGVNWRIKND